MDIELIAIDIDGTLLDAQHQLSARNIAAVQQAMAAGVQVVLATGRRRASCLSILAQLQLNTPGLFIQGLHIADADGQLLRAQFLPATVVRLVADFMHASDYGVTGYGAERLLTERHNRHTQSGAGWSIPQLTNDLSASPQHLLITHGEPAELAALRPHLEAQVAGMADTVMSSPRMLEVLPRHGSKGDGLLWLVNHLGISAEKTLAIGNAENDIELLKAAKIGVAVANAEPLIKDSADFVVADHNHDGVAEAIERFAL